MTAAERSQLRGCVAAVYEHIRDHGPLAVGRYTPAGQCAQATGVTVTRAIQILDQLERTGRVRLDRAPRGKRGRGRIIRAEAMP